MSATLRAGFLGCLALLMNGCGGERVSDATRRQLSSSDPALRERAVDELSINQSAEATRLLIAALSDSSRGVRIGAAESLGRRKARDATPALIAALRDSEMWVRAQAAGALGKTRAKEAVQPLVEMMKDNLAKKPQGRPISSFEGKDIESAAWALRQITGQDFGLDTAKWEKLLAEKNTGRANR